MKPQFVILGWCELNVHESVHRDTIIKAAGCEVAIQKLKDQDI
jgi:hypothetical protein